MSSSGNGAEGKRSIPNRIQCILWRCAFVGFDMPAVICVLDELALLWRCPPPRRLNTLWTVTTRCARCWQRRSRRQRLMPQEGKMWPLLFLIFCWEAGSRTPLFCRQVRVRDGNLLHCPDAHRRAFNKVRDGVDGEAASKLPRCPQQVSLALYPNPSQHHSPFAEPS